MPLLFQRYAKKTRPLEEKVHRPFTCSTKIETVAAVTNEQVRILTAALRTAEDENEKLKVHHAYAPELH